jgi:hypothetical protein
MRKFVGTSTTTLWPVLLVLLATLLALVLSDPALYLSLVEKLKLAAQLEHGLLVSYLTAAASIKTRMEEFTDYPERSPVHFEYARDWKRGIMSVAKEEMRHLHLVNELLRSLGAAPEFGLAPRRRNAMVVSDWNDKLARTCLVPLSDNAKCSNETLIPFRHFDLESIRDFVGFEATDSFQDAVPSTSLTQQIREWEIKQRVEGILPHGDESDVAYLEKLYNGKPLARFPRLPDAVHEMVIDAEGLIHDATSGKEYDELLTAKFQSIADLYKQINESYTAFFNSTRSKHEFEKHLHDIIGFEKYMNDDDAQEGFMPVGRRVFDHGATLNEMVDNYMNPLISAANVSRMIEEIVLEGEGFPDFVNKATDMMHSGIKDLQLTGSHLYTFLTISLNLRHETNLANAKGYTLHPSHTVVPSSPELDALGRQAVCQTNAIYLVLRNWLTQLYSEAKWANDQEFKRAFKMLGTGVLMSMGVRPALELASFFGINATDNLFREDEEGFTCNLKAVALWQLSHNKSISVPDYRHRMVDLSLQILTEVASWAEATLPQVPSIFEQREIAKVTRR